MFELYLLLAFCVSYATALSEHPILIVVSYDAFRYNYFEKNITPNMERLRIAGTYTDYMINVFPTKTFPNHHSIATGLYTESHGVVGNSFYDPTIGEIIKISYDMWHYNDDIEPIWIRNEKAARNRHSGIMMWPGGSHNYQDINATYAQNWDHDYDWNKRIDTAISWILNPIKPANLVMIYFEEPDFHNHIYGPDSDIAFNLIQRLDNATQYLHDQLKTKNLQDKVNVIHLSDHGMSSVSPPNIINITQYLEPNTYIAAGSSPTLHFIPNKGYEDDIYYRLKNASISIGNFSVYKKENLPSRWHFKNNPRTPNILVLANEGYAFQDLFDAIETNKKSYNLKVTNESKFGVHGYDNDLKDMYPFFMAWGPGIRRHHKVPPFHTVDLYNLFCALLEIQPAPNNGTLASVRDILVTQPKGFSSGSAASELSTTATTSSILFVVGSVIAAVLLVSCGAIATLVMIKRQQSIATIAALNKRFTSNAASIIEAQHLLEHEDAWATVT